MSMQPTQYDYTELFLFKRKYVDVYKSHFECHVISIFKVHLYSAVLKLVTGQIVHIEFD